MHEYLIRDLKIAISKAVESSYNAMRTASGDLYVGMQTTSRSIYIPDKEKLDDTGKIGTGNEFPTQQRSGYVTVPSLEIADEVDIDVCPIFLRRALGGAVTVSSDVEASLGFYNQTFGMLSNNTAAGRQLPSSTLLWSLGAADYMWGGVVVDQLRFEQTNAGVPTYTATLIGSGLNKRLRYLTADGNLAVNGSNAYNGPYAGASGTEYPPSFPAPPVQRYMLGAETICQFNDGVNYVITQAQRMKSFNLTLNNAHRTDDRRAGDPRLTSAQPRDGFYVNRMLHGDRSVAAEMTVMLDDVMREYSDAYNDTQVTSFKFTMAGNLLKKATSPYTESAADNQGEVELIMPLVYFRSARGADDNGDAIVTISLFPVYDTGNQLFPLSARVLTNTNTPIV